MKATIYWKDCFNGKRHQKTFEVTENEPNSIVRLARQHCYLGRHDYVTAIKCGRYIYEGYGEPSV